MKKFGQNDHNTVKQHLLFQEFLKKEKEEVSQKLRKKIFPSTEYEDYDFLTILGQGNFGTVVAAENTVNNKIFAIKIIEKKHLVRKERLKFLLSEIRILNSVKFEFLISLECYFTNDCFVFLVLPYISGGHFFQLLKSVVRFEEGTAKFFAGQVNLPDYLAIEYLHYMGIIYRDLKPENLLVDSEGYLKLVDFGFAKNIGYSYSYSFCGTPEYLAPEILLSKGHNSSADWWSFGILLFEMCNGTPPFTSRNEFRLFEKILAGRIDWPSHFSSELKQLLQGLLQVDKTKRFGCKRQKAAEIKFHKWFSRLDWGALWKKSITSPFNSIPGETHDYVSVDKSKFSNKKCSNIIPSALIGNIDFSV